MSAVLSPDRRYRYRLRRNLPPMLGSDPEAVCAFVMLNPSTADASLDDPTVRRCMRFAVDLGYAALEVVNLYAYRATDPRHLWAVRDPEGPCNDTHLRAALTRPLVIAAWGLHAPKDRVRRFTEMAKTTALFCLGTTDDGSPRGTRCTYAPTPHFSCGNLRIGHSPTPTPSAAPTQHNRR